MQQNLTDREIELQTLVNTHLSQIVKEVEPDFPLIRNVKEFTYYTNILLVKVQIIMNMKFGIMEHIDE